MKRLEFIKQITALFQVHPIVALLGPRQCGKTTLAKDYIRLKKKTFPEENFFDLEDDNAYTACRLYHDK